MHASDFAHFDLGDYESMVVEEFAGHQQAEKNRTKGWINWLLIEDGWDPSYRQDLDDAINAMFDQAEDIQKEITSDTAEDYEGYALRLRATGQDGGDPNHVLAVVRWNGSEMIGEVLPAAAKPADDATGYDLDSTRFFTVEVYKNGNWEEHCTVVGLYDAIPSAQNALLSYGSAKDAAARVLDVNGNVRAFVESGRAIRLKTPALPTDDRKGFQVGSTEVGDEDLEAVKNSMAWLGSTISMFIAKALAKDGMSILEDNLTITPTLAADGSSVTGEIVVNFTFRRTS